MNSLSETGASPLKTLQSLREQYEAMKACRAEAKRNAKKWGDEEALSGRAAKVLLMAIEEMERAIALAGGVSESPVEPSVEPSVEPQEDGRLFPPAVSPSSPEGV